MITKEEYHKLVEAEANAIKELYLALGSILAVAKYLGITYYKVHTKLLKQDIILKKGRRIGQFSVDTSLIDKEIYEVYLASGMKFAIIAEQYNVSRQRIAQRIARYEKRNGLEKKRNDLKMTRICGNPKCQKEFKGRQSRYCSPECSDVMIFKFRQTSLPIEKMIEEYLSGDGFSKIAKRYDCYPSSVHYHLKRLGITSRPRPPQLQLPNPLKAP